MLSIGGDEEFGTKLQSIAISSEMGFITMYVCGFPTTIVATAAMQIQAGEDENLRASEHDRQTDRVAWHASA